MGYPRTSHDPPRVRRAPRNDVAARGDGASTIQRGRPHLKRAARRDPQSTRTEGTMAKVTGIGGIFFKSREDSARLAAWYQEHLGLPIESFGGAILRWPDDRADDGGLTVWSVAKKESQWF